MGRLFQGKKVLSAARPTPGFQDAEADSCVPLNLVIVSAMGGHAVTG